MDLLEDNNGNLISNYSSPVKPKYHGPVLNISSSFKQPIINPSSPYKPIGVTTTPLHQPVGNFKLSREVSPTKEN